MIVVVARATSVSFSPGRSTPRTMPRRIWLTTASRREIDDASINPGRDPASGCQSTSASVTIRSIACRLSDKKTTHLLENRGRARAVPQTDRVPLRDRLLALLVAVCWGVNFPATTLALQHFPPLLMVALRFALIAIPTMIFVPWPKVPARWLIGVGLGIGTMQFALLYVAMAIGMPAGLASMVLQASGPFTILLGALFLRERLSGRQVVGFVVAVAGLVVIAVHRSLVAALVPVLLTLGAALGWAIGNICSRQARAPKPLHLTLWMSVVAPLPLLGLSLLFEGPRRDWDALRTL